MGAQMFNSDRFVRVEHFYPVPVCFGVLRELMQHPLGGRVVLKRRHVRSLHKIGRFTPPRHLFNSRPAIVWWCGGASVRPAIALFHAQLPVILRSAIVWERVGVTPSQGGVEE